MDYQGVVDGLGVGPGWVRGAAPVWGLCGVPAYGRVIAWGFGSVPPVMLG